MLSTERILKASSFDAISGRKLFDIFHREYQDCFLAIANPPGYIMLGYLCSTHFTGECIVREARLTKIKIHLNAESKSISCLAGAGKWYLNSSSCLSHTQHFDWGKGCLAGWRRSCTSPDWSHGLWSYAGWEKENLSQEVLHPAHLASHRVNHGNTVCVVRRLPCKLLIII